MRTAGFSTIPAGMMVAAGTLFLASCATLNRPQQFRTFLVPPPIAHVSAAEPVAEPPRLTASLYASEMPFLAIAPPDIPRPSETDFLLKKANDSFNAGKLAIQTGDSDAARHDFDAAIQTLLAAPDNLPERSRLEKRLDELIDSIYKMDVDQANSEVADDQVSYDKSPLDGVLEMTFPVDPSLRSKIREQIQATASDLPLEESDAVIGAINFFSSERGKKIVAAGIRRSGRYKPMIERILAQEGLPPELIFVAQAESGFLPRAMSNKACVGLWQFAKFRGQEYGLEQTASTDDRMDPEKATRAAAKHLHDLYSHFGDWYLALAAYDCGPGCVDHAIMRTGYADFWELRKRNVFPVKETDNYVPVILAMIIMSKNAKDYGLDNLEMDPPVEYDTIELPSSTHIDLAADAVGRSVSELKDLNPALIRSVGPAGYTLHIPKGTLPALETAFSVIPANKRDSWRIHRVEPGDTLAGLAKRYNASAALVSEVNHAELPASGEWAAIPVAYPGDRTVSHKTTTSQKHSRKSHTSAKIASAPASAQKPEPRAGAGIRTVSARAASSKTASSRTGSRSTTAQKKTAPKKTTAIAHRSTNHAPAHHAAAASPAG